MLHGTGPGDWKGKAAEAFREKFEDDFRPKTDEARDSFGMAATALEGWAEYMRVQQATARRLEQEAEDAERELSKALRKLESATDDDEPSDVGPPDRYRPAGTAGDKPDRAREEEQRREAQSAVDGASVRLEDVRRRARSLADDYRAEGHAVANRLRGAMDIAPDEPGLFDKIGDTISDLSGAFGEYLETVAEGIAKLADDVVQWVEDHAAHIAAIGDVFAVISAVSGAISSALYIAAGVTKIPHLGVVAGAFGNVSAGTATVAFAAHGLARLAGADVSDRTLAQDAVGAIPLVNVRFVGNTGRAIADSQHARGASLLGLADTWVGLVANPEAFQHFVPEGNRQKVQMFLPTGAGVMLVAVENAWNSA
ncbi:hypothetical protein ACHZ98_10620 [Streptomyces sp. MAR4 CNY-716]